MSKPGNKTVAKFSKKAFISLVFADKKILPVFLLSFSKKLFGFQKSSFYEFKLPNITQFQYFQELKLQFKKQLTLLQPIISDIAQRSVTTNDSYFGTRRISFDSQKTRVTSATDPF